MTQNTINLMKIWMPAWFYRNNHAGSRIFSQTKYLNIQVESSCKLLAMEAI